MAKWDFLKRLGQSASHDIVPVERQLSRAEQEAALAAQGAERNPIGDLDISGEPLPKDALNANTDLVPTSPAPSARESAEMATALSDQKLSISPEERAGLDSIKNQEGPVSSDIPSSAEDRYNKWKNLGLVGGAGLAGTAAMNMGGDNQPPQQATQAPQIPEAPSKPLATPAAPEDQSSEEEKAVLNQMAAARRPGVEERETVPESTPLDFGSGESVASVQKLQNIQNKIRRALQNNEYARIGAAAAAGMGGNKNYYDEILADKSKRLAEEPALYQKQVEMEKEDPNSPQSQGMRSLAGAMGFPVSGTASAADLEKQFPQLANIYNQRVAQANKKDLSRENREARSQDLAMRYAQMKDQRLEKLGLKDEDRLIKLNQQLNSPQMGSARNALGRNQLIINGADKIGALIGSAKNPDQLTGRQVYEIAKSLDGMLSMGSPTISGTDKLMPKTLMSELAKGGEYAMNKPVGAQMGLFVKQMKDLIERERGIAEKQNNGFKQQLTAGLPEDFTKRRQKDIDRMINVHVGDMAHSIDPTHPSSNTIKVQTKDGKVWNIPKEKLQDALNRGAKEI